MECTCPEPGYCPTFDKKQDERFHAICRNEARMADGSLMPAAHCATYRHNWAVVAALRGYQSPYACSLRGEKVGELPCLKCNKQPVTVPVFACPLHGRTVLAGTNDEMQLGFAEALKRGDRPELWQCALCKDRVPLPPRFVLHIDQHGYGDAITAAWLAEGSKAHDSPIRVTLASSNHCRRELLTIFGLEVLPGDAPGRNMMGMNLNGDTPRLAHWCNHLRIPARWARPTATVPAEAIEWATRLGVTPQTVLLFPQTYGGCDRRWPNACWHELRRLLTAAGRECLTILANPETDFPDAWSGVPWGKLLAVMQLAACGVGNDSGPAHVMGTLDRPFVAILGGQWKPAIYAHVPSVRCLYSGRLTDNLPADVCQAVGDAIGKPFALPPLILHAPSRLWIRSAPLAKYDLATIHEQHAQQYYRVPPQRKGAVFVDVGAHIGSWARWVLDTHRGARVVCVEANPDNLECLAANVGREANIVHGALTYTRLPVLYSSIHAGTRTTGSSEVRGVGDEPLACNLQFDLVRDERPLPALTLEELMRQQGLTRVDVLKLDCEGSEHSILASGCLRHVGMVVGEWHDWDRFIHVVHALAGWRLEPLTRPGEQMGLFHLIRR